MEIKITHAEGSVVNINGVVTGDEWKQAQEKAIKKLAKEVEVKGFRKGAAPEALARQSINPQKMLDEAVNSLLSKAYTQALTEHNLDPIEQPDVKVTKLSDTELEFTISVTVRPEVTLGQYMGLKVTQEPILITDLDVEEEIKKLQQENAQFEVKADDAAVEDGDIAVIDFEGFIDNVAFEGGKGENHELEIGSGTFIPGFEPQIIGMKKGETKDIVVTFPSNYTPELASKEATFKVKVNEIKVKVLPELNDSFALDVNKEGVSTYEQLVDTVREELRADKKKQSEDKAFNQLLKMINDASSVDIPEKVITENVEAELEDFKRRIASNGMTYESYLEMAKVDEEKIREDIRVSLKDRIKLSFVLGRIGQDNKITVSEEEVDHELQHIADTYKMELAAVKNALKDRMVEISNDLFMRKVEEFIKQNNTIA
jgi:trigger factor